VIQGAEEIERAITRRIDPDGLYLCGPFDQQGKSASQDIHILALSRGDEIKDLHFLPGLTGSKRRVEVSVIPTRLVEVSERDGVRTWLGFYTLDKIIRGKPLSESLETSRLRRSLLKEVKLRPSFYAQGMANLRDVWHKPRRPSAPAEMGLRSNLVMLLSLCLYSLLSLKRTFSRNSDLVGQTEQVWRVGNRDQQGAEVVLASARCFLEAVLTKTAFKVEAVAGRHLDSPSREELE
jgi:hypothetical protein